jgi:HK97 family phage major capsid protein
VANAYSSAVIYPENTAITGNEPTFTQKSLYAYKYGFLMSVSRELAEDTQIDLLGFLAKQAGVAIGNGVGNDYLNGAGHGAGQPAGLLTASIGSTLGVTSASGSGGVPTADNLIDLFYSVKAPSRANGTWLLLDATVGAIRKLKGVSNDYLWTPGFGASPDTILGRPVITDPYVPTTATGAKSVLFGDFSQYYVRRAGGVRFEASQDFKFDYDVTTFKVTVRTDGVLMDPTALKHFIGNAA